LIRQHLCVHAANHTPVRVDRRTLFRKLAAAVENRDQVAGNRRLDAFKPAHQHWQLAAVAGFVCRTQQMPVGLRDRQGALRAETIGSANSVSAIRIGDSP
jgi:hypothetical protein